MLKTPSSYDQEYTGILQLIAQSQGYTGLDVKEIAPGFLVINSFNLDNLVNPHAPFYMHYPVFAGPEYPEEWLNPYGVCDTPQQFIERFKSILEKDVRTFVVGFTHVEKDPENKGRGGGWRWHKWGPYIGTGAPAMEYLDDEEGFENGIYVYSIVQTDGPEVKAPWDKSPVTL